MDTATVTLGVALVAAVGSPLAIVTNAWVHRRDKREDWRRQDEVALRLSEQADKVAGAVRDSTAATRTQLTQIQTTGKETNKLVDGARTAQLRTELGVQQGLAAMTHHTLALIRKAGDSPDPNILRLLAVTEARIKELEPLIAARDAALEKTDARPAGSDSSGTTG